MTEPTQEQWLELHDAFKDYCESAPWEWMDDRDVVAILHPSRGYKGYCVILGGGGVEYGLAVYLDDLGLASYLSAITGELEDDDPEGLATMNALAAMRADRNELSQRDRDTIRSLGLRYRGRGRWPFFRSTLPGYVPWYLDGEEAAFLALALRQVNDVATRFKTGMLKLYSPENDQLILTRFLEGGAWQERWEPLATPELPVQDVPEYSDTGRLEELKTLKTVSSHVWEFDMFHLPFPERLEKGDRPYLPVTAIIADRDSPLCWSKSHPGPNPSAGHRQDLLVGLFEVCPFMPGEIVVDSPVTADLLRPVTEPLEIRLSVGETPEAYQVRFALNEFF